MKRSPLIQQLLLYRYRYFIAYFVVIATTIVILGTELRGLLPGIADIEATSGLASTDGSALDNPLYAPYRALQWLTITIFGADAIGLRLASVIFGAATAGLTFMLFRIWHRPRIAIVSSLLLVFSSWFMHSARLGSPEISIAFSITALLAAFAWIHHYKVPPMWAVIVAAAALGFSMYVPLMIYFVILLFAMQRQAIKDQIHRFNSRQLLFGILVFLAVIAPLLIGFIRDITVLRDWLALPTTLPSFGDYLGSVFDVFGRLFWGGEGLAYLQLANLPTLDIFTATMTALGMYHYEQHWGMLRTKILLPGFALMLFLVALSGNEALTVAILPFVYIFAATGIITLLTQWNKIFPRNPIARTIGLASIIVVLGFGANYHTTRYFIAWPRTPETKRAFAPDTSLLREDAAKFDLPPSSSATLVLVEESALERMTFSVSDFDNADVRRGVTDAELTDYSTIYVSPEVAIPPTLANTKPARFINSDQTTEPLAFRVYEIAEAEEPQEDVESDAAATE